MNQDSLIKCVTLRDTLCKFEEELLKGFGSVEEAKTKVSLLIKTISNVSVALERKINLHTKNYNKTLFKIVCFFKYIPSLFLVTCKKNSNFFARQMR